MQRKLHSNYKFDQNPELPIAEFRTQILKSVQFKLPLSRSR